MARMLSIVAAIVMVACAHDGHARIVQGRLELQWGDPGAAMGAQGPKSGANREPRFNVNLVTDRERVPLDPAQAMRAAGDLHALMGRQVAVEFRHGKSAVRGAATRIGINAIVPADDIGNQRLHPFAGKVDAVPKAMLGSKRWLTLACKFSDVVEEQQTIAYFRAQYGDEPGRLGHYWREVSYQKINLQGSDALGWYTLPHPRSHYVTRDSGNMEKADLGKLFTDCAQAADGDVDYGTIFGLNMMFNADLDGFAWGGSHCATLDGVRRCFPNTWNPPWAFNNLGILAHEMGHAYGLPHSDNSDGDSDTYDNPWDVMSDSWRNAVQDGTYGTRPKHISTLQRDRLGWIEAPRKQVSPPTGDDAVWVNLDFAHLAPGQSTGTQMLVLQAEEMPDPYLANIHVVEARQRTGLYDGALAGTAVIIHSMGSNYRSVAQSQDADRPPATVSNNEGSMFKVGETWRSADGLFTVFVEAQTATGFVVRLGKPRTTAGPLPPRRR